MQKSINPAFKAPPERNPASVDYPLYFKKELASWDSIHLEHELTSQEKRVMEHWLNRTDHPEFVHTTLTRVVRVIIKPGHFELDDGSIAPADKTPKEAIVYSLSQYIDDPNYIKEGGASGVSTLSWDHYTEGVYPRHQAELRFDNRGNIIDSIHKGYKYIYYIRWDPKAVKKLLEEHEHDRTLSLACAVASEGIGTAYEDSPSVSS